jgi:hypothetical protein
VIRLGGEQVAVLRAVCYAGAGAAMHGFLSDGKKVLAAAIVFAVLVAAWMLRYEITAGGVWHVNRFTGAVCAISESCWFRSVD